ncbi:TetR/AcrR family transcriptional regulator [Saccharopolyspora erythraea]|uniref:TetR/AcrR family transcriptional regulator n=1 Tax=Saccharopolyspora erythraea TaxID=1836 RepID=UPI001BA555FF|nr:TetR/AcrR family transcriptional regulator [Saccharopolyspora erythraea]QUH00854.1 TetR/AcrR family transcriptional regulator [Saccharopolyspora erythraea]
MTAKPKTSTSESTPGAVWFRPEKQSRAKPLLTQDKIVSAAVELLDRDGVRQLSMRKLADRLQAHATSLYWHVSTKDDVLDLALDAVFGEVRLPAEPGTSWRDDVIAFMAELRRVLLGHPWAAALASTRPLAGPNALARSEFVYAALAGAGFGRPDVLAAGAAVSNYVIGSVSAESVWRHQDEAGTRSALAEHLRAREADYPALAGNFPVDGGDWQAHFERGAQYLVAGMAATAGRNEGATEG